MAVTIFPEFTDLAANCTTTPNSSIPEVAVVTVMTCDCATAAIAVANSVKKAKTDDHSAQ